MIVGSARRWRSRHPRRAPHGAVWDARVSKRTVAGSAFPRLLPVAWIAVLANYSDVLRLHGAWRFSLAGFILRLPMSLVGISTILLVKAEYGNYTLAGAVSAANMIALAVGAPILARLVDTRGQRAVMGPSFTISALSLVGLVVTALMTGPAVLLFLFAVVAGATWGAPGALVRSRWMKTVDNQRQLPTAYALEAAVDEFAFIIGPIMATMLGTLVSPASGLVLSIAFLTVGGFLFLSQTSSEPEPAARVKGERMPSVMLNPVVIVLALTYVGAGSMFGAIDVSVVAFTEFHGVAAFAGALLALFALGSLTAALIYGSRHWNQPLWKLFAVGVTLLALGVSALLTASNVWALGLILLVTGMTIAPTMTNVTMIITKVVPGAQLTEGLTWMSTAMNIGASLGAAAGGRAIDARGAHGGFLVAVAAACLMVFLMLSGLRRLRRDTMHGEKEQGGQRHPEVKRSEGGAESEAGDSSEQHQPVLP